MKECNNYKTKIERLYLTMEDITKYIGLIGFVPWIILLIYGFAKEPIKCIQVILILALILLFSGGGTWGITTLGGLL